LFALYLPQVGIDCTRYVNISVGINFFNIVLIVNNVIVFLSQTSLPWPKYVMTRVIPGSPVLRTSEKIVPAILVRYKI